MPRPILWLLVSLTASCANCDVASTDSGQTGVRLSPSTLNVAMGASFDLAVLDTCSDAEFEIDGNGGKIPSNITIDFERQTCEFSTIDALDAAASDEAVVAVASSEALETYGIVRLKALGEGTAAIDITASTSTGEHALRGEVQVFAANRAKLTALCGENGSRKVDEGVLYAMAGSTLMFEHGIFHDEVPLYGYDFFPFDFGALETTEFSSTTVQISLPAEAGSHTITSSVDEGLERVVRVITPSDVDTLKLSSDRATCQTTVWWAPNIDDQPVGICAGALQVTLTSDTPDVCVFAGGDVTASPNFSDAENANGHYLRSVGPGTCRVRGGVVGSDLTETLEVAFPDCVAWEKPVEHRVLALAPVPTGETLAFTLGHGVFLLDGDLVTEVPALAELPQNLYDAWASATDAVTILAYEELITWKDSVLDRTDLGRPFASATPFATDVLLVGQNVAARYGMRGTEAQPVDAVTFTKVWAHATGAVATGYSGSTPHEARVASFDGEVWSVEPMTSVARLHGVWGTGPADIFAVGDGCAVLHYDGAQWTEHDLGCKKDLKAVHGSASDRVVAVGDADIVATWDNSNWSLQWLMGESGLTEVNVGADGILLGGNGGAYRGP